MRHTKTSKPVAPPVGQASSSLRSGWMRRNVAVYFVGLIASIGILLLVLVSPLLLSQLGNEQGVNWSKLSEIGQTYGAASAILSGFALLGVSFSLLIQRRQTRAESIGIVRERHMELTRMILNDPDIYGPVVGMSLSHDADGRRRSLFATMWINYAWMSYQLGVLPETALRDELLAGAFDSGFTRDWWNAARPDWIHYSGDKRRDRQFIRIMDEEYNKAVTAGPPTVRPREESMSQRERRRANCWRIPASMTIGITSGVLFKSFLLKRKMEHRACPTRRLRCR